MDDEVKRSSPATRRPYRAPRRAQQAAATRRAILAAARTEFVRHGYGPCTVAQIADTAGVSVDTVYTSVGRKPALLRELVETSLSGEDRAVPADQRPYVREVKAATQAADKLTIYATALPTIHQRMAPIFEVLSQAASVDRDCAALWDEISQRRARNMLELAGELRATGELRADLSDAEVADIIWSLNAVEYYLLLVKGRGWSPARYGSWLADAWVRLLLA
ncbi:AcrR family transcriptional regulator [Microlunatus panaciterrae]|uniref:AcrR family transcriptional regulator n=1 Tax=Microlunatus panaciterrae TaxID=400768 RepID=A0ABS2RG47_9ACTN|nr:TetR/AcrR family transcriptional regulator [Microlunatus panaciterrae]MBM7797980.1 AcrR family transcriptional regulator [Microlunatus panaciterrae]